MWGSIRWGLTASLIVVALMFLGVAALAAFGGADITEGMTAPVIILIFLIAVGVAAMWVAITLLDGLFDDLERLRTDIVTVNPIEPAMPRRWLEQHHSAPDELTRVAIALSELMERQRQLSDMPDRRLAAVLGSVETGLLVVTESGLVSLVNAGAEAALRSSRVSVGTNVYGVLEREDLVLAMEQARAAGRPVATMLQMLDGHVVEARIASLGDHGGAVISFPGAPAGATTAVSALRHDLALHDSSPVPRVIDDLTPLDELPVVVLDTETTGLDVEKDRIIAIGAVPLQGPRIFYRLALDRLINPGMPIPRPATRVHGITNAMVLLAPPFETVYGEVRALLQGAVVVGHNIGFDLALLRAECRRADLAWDEPPTIDTGQLVAALDGRVTDLNLEAVAQLYGIELQGRHTALGDSLVTAELYIKLIALLKDQGIATLGGARAFAANARVLIGLQEDAGWGK